MMNRDFFITSEKLDPISGERMRVHRHYSGFSLTHIPRQGYHVRTLIVGVMGGASSTRFIDPRTGELRDLPQGTPHALKHMVLLNLPAGEGDAAGAGNLEQEMARRGVTLEDWTGYDVTAFRLESDGELIDEGRVLLSTLLSPLAPEVQESLEREKEVLRAERRLYLDDLSRRQNIALTRLLFPTQDLGLDYVGTEASLTEMTVEDLLAYQRAFYVPGNLRLVAVGDFAEDQLLRMVEEIIAEGINKHQGEAQLQHSEPEAPERKSMTSIFPAHEPSFALGFSDLRRCGERRLYGTEYFLYRWAGQIGLDLLLGEGSELYEDLRAKGWIDKRFHLDYITEKDLAYIQLTGYHPQPEQAVEAITEAILDAVNRPLDPTAFNIKKKALMGDILSELDHLASVASLEMRCAMQGFDLYDYPQILRRLDLKQVEESLAFLRDENLCRQGVAYFLPPERVEAGRLL